MITGASRGIGAAAASRFAAAGWDLLLLARSNSDLETVAAPLLSGGRRVEWLAADLTDAQGLPAQLADLLGRGLQ
ncbi:MAG: SDR family NAD(P)-dependent oxidoreductase, partial [Cyanobacteria bacterium]|nr:SDR family NAD(P)-dependent oxidoreductase [Cyanobacteriota bacterium]